MADNTGKNNRFPLLDILGYLKNIHKNPKYGKVRQVPTREIPTKFPGWDLSPRGGALGYFLGGYVPPGTPNWHPVLEKISPKIDTPF